MTNEEIRNMVWKKDTNVEEPPFVSQFCTLQEKEITLVFYVWLSNGTRHENHVFCQLIKDIMNNKPLDFVLSYDGCYENDGKESFCGLLTYEQLHNILTTLQEIYSSNSSLLETFIKNQEKAKNKFAHTILSKIFGGNSGFPTEKSASAYYRYNLLVYLLTYRLNVWNDILLTYRLNVWNDIVFKALIPCNDKVFENARKLKIGNIGLKSGIKNATLLTEKAKEVFGDDYYKMYEMLNAYV